MSFFGKILGTSQDSHLPIEDLSADLVDLPNEWGSFSTLIDERMASIRLNLALDSVAPYPSYTYALRLKIAILNVDPETGFPDYDEFSTLNLIEDRLSEAMKRIAAIYVGVVITDGHIEFYYYLKDRERHMPIIAQVMEQFSKYQYSSATLVDPEWKQYFDFLYPNEYEYQSILNQRIWYRLDKEGMTIVNYGKSLISLVLRLTMIVFPLWGMPLLLIMIFLLGKKKKAILNLTN